MAKVLVTGCNRGIGLQLCKQLAARGDEVIGVRRTPSPELENLGIRPVTGIDVSRGDAMPRLSAALGDERLDVLINNAGILRPDALGELRSGQMVEQFKLHTLGPLRVTEAFLNNLAEGSRVAIVTSRVGSIADTSSGN